MVLLFAAVCLGGLSLIALNMGLRGPWSNEFALSAEFTTANGLVPQAEVRVSGVHVGTVTAINDSGGGDALVRMALQPGIRLRQDTRAVIRPKTLLGEKFVELVRKQGSTQDYLASGALIPKAQTGQAVEIDDILNAMDAPTRKAMSESFRQLGIALDGRQQDIGAALPPLDATMTNLRPLARVGESRQQELDRILTNLNTIMQALADTVRNGAAVFGSLDAAFSGVTSADRSSLQKSPATIAAGRRTLGLTNPQVDQLLPEILLGQISYPNDQLNITDAESLTLAAEWISAFSQQDATGYHSLRITCLTPSLQKMPGALPGDLGGGTPTAPQDLADLLLQTLGNSR